MADDPILRKQWQVPRFGSPLKEMAAWAKQQVKDGMEFQKSEPGYNELQESIRVLSNDPSEALALKQKDDRYSRVRTNRLKRNLREMVGTISDIRYAPGFHAANNDVQMQAGQLNKLGSSWYVDRFIDIRIKEAVQWMAISKRGWLEICYRRIPGERNRAAIDCIPMPDCDVAMTGVPASRDFQEAYTVSVIKDLPVYLAHSLFPDQTDKLIPNKETPNGWRERIRQVYADVFAPSPTMSTAKNPTVTLYYTYVNDFSINKSGSPKRMGYVKDELTGQESESPWSYIVPSLGSDIPIGRTATGEIAYRKARAEDCRLFPGRRLIITSETSDVALYDGPMFDWHGRVPLIRLTADSWPFGDYSMCHDVIPMHDTINEVDRISHQTLRNRFNPSLLYNIKAITRDKAKSLRAEVQGQRIGFNGSESTDPVKPLLPAGFNVIEQWVSDFRKYLVDETDYEMGVRDISALAKMKSGAGLDSLEKALEQAGPIVKSISRDMERQMRDLADMFKWLVFQYYTTPKIMQVVGVDGITPENFDFDPGNLIPSHLPGEDKTRPSVFSSRDRAQWLADHIPFFITPNTLHEITQSTQKLVILQLARAGLVPFDPWTLAEVFRIGNFGKVPDQADSIMDRYFAWEEVKALRAIAIAAKVEQAKQALGMGGGDEDGGGGGGEGGGGGTGAPGLGPKGGPKGTGGRAPTGQTMPQAKQKGDGRPVITESK